MISFAGVPLLTPAPPHAAALLAAADLWPDGAAAMRARLPNRPPLPNCLYWPWGASRHGRCHAFAADPQREAVLAALGGGNGPADLVLADGVRTLTARMYLLPARPVDQAFDPGAALPGVPGSRSWLLTLVDQRYFWWFRSANVALTAGTTTWAQLYAAIGAALGATIAADPVPAAYLHPPADFASAYAPLPPLLDAAARSVGQRIVCGLDGTVRAMSAANSLALQAANLGLRPRAAGGDFDLAG